MSLRLNEAVPKWEIVETSRRSSTEASTMAGVELYDQRQPKITSGERELSRLIVVAAVAIAFCDDGDPVSCGRSDVGTATAVNLVGATVFTDRRAVGTLVRGDFFDNKLNIDRDGMGVLFEFPYEQIASLELEMKAKAFGGTKPVAIWMHARNPYGAGLRLEVTGSSTLEGRVGRTGDLSESFREIADAVALHSRPHVYPEARDLIDAYLANGPTTSDEGNPIVLFEPEDATGVMPLVQISEAAPATPDSEESPQIASPRELDSPALAAGPIASAPEERVIMARFCAKCGSPFEGEEAFCSACGTPRQRKMVAT